MLKREHRSTRRMTCVTSSIASTIKTSLLLNPALHDDGPGTNRLNHSMASSEFHFKNSDAAQPECYFTDRNMYKLKTNKPSSEYIPHLKTIVGPRTKLHDAALLIKRKILNIDLTGRLVDSWRFPGNISFECDNRLCHQSHLIVSVRATNKQQFKLMQYLLLDKAFDRRQIRSLEDLTFAKKK